MWVIGGTWHQGAGGQQEGWNLVCHVSRRGPRQGWNLSIWEVNFYIVAPPLSGVSRGSVDWAGKQVLVFLPFFSRPRIPRCWISSPKTSPGVGCPIPLSTTSEWVSDHLVSAPSHLVSAPRCLLTSHQLVSPQLCVILEPMQELMSRHKTYSLSPRDCLKTCLFQKWQRMVAPPGECLAPAPALSRMWCCSSRLYLLTPHETLSLLLGLQDWDQGRLRSLRSQIGEQGAPGPTLPDSPFPGTAEPARQQPSKRRKRKMSGGSTMSSGGGNTNNSNSKKKSPASTFALSSQVPVSISAFFSLLGCPTADLWLLTLSHPELTSTRRSKEKTVFPTGG